MLHIYECICIYAYILEISTTFRKFTLFMLKIQVQKVRSLHGIHFPLIVASRDDVNSKLGKTKHTRLLKRFHSGHSEREIVH